MVWLVWCRYSLMGYNIFSEDVVEYSASIVRELANTDLEGRSEIKKPLPRYSTTRNYYAVSRYCTGIDQYAMQCVWQISNLGHEHKHSI